MGEAALKREFDKQPPREPLISIAALWRDYLWRYVNAGRSDPAVAYTAKSKDIFEAIQRACDSKGEDGKTFFHQGRVWPVNRQALAERMKTDEKHYHTLRESKSFVEMFQYVDMVCDEVKGIGEVTKYDVASRLAAYLDLEPTRLYFHAGVSVGLKALGIELPRGRKYLKRKELPEFFHDKNLDLLESFLCGYRSEIERVIKAKRRIKQYDQNSSNSSRVKRRRHDRRAAN